MNLLSGLVATAVMVPAGIGRDLDRGVLCTLSAAFATVFYLAGGPTRRHTVQVPIEQEMGVSEA